MTEAEPTLEKITDGFVSVLFKLQQTLNSETGFDVEFCFHVIPKDSSNGNSKLGVMPRGFSTDPSLVEAARRAAFRMRDALTDLVNDCYE